MSYKIVNNRNTPLNSFHSNGGFEIKDVFPCSNNCYSVFSTEEEAQEYLSYIFVECENQRGRWKDWTDKALNFAKTLKIKE
jgi:hypothetical protein